MKTKARDTLPYWESGPYELDGETRCRWHRHRSEAAARRSAERYARRGRRWPSHVTACGAGAEDGWWADPAGHVYRVRSSDVEADAEDDRP